MRGQDAPQRSMARRGTPSFPSMLQLKFEPALRQLGLLGQVEPARLGSAARQRPARQAQLPRPARAAAQAGAGEARLARRAVAGARQLGPLGRAGVARRVVRAEDLLLGLAGEQRLELVALDRLALEQPLGNRRTPRARRRE